MIVTNAPGRDGPMNIQASQMEAIAAICRQAGVTRLYLFGSALRDDFAGDSDVDLAVSFAHHDIKGSLDRFFAFKDQMEQLFGRSVDVVCVPPIRNRFFREEIVRTGRLLYAA